ncbi:MAG: GntR family transcriptional regulator [Pseudarcicella sp.]|nr:GntR family transcriptional regulator [Pseudarcicella sp.]MBP6411630.1 GntR family transcriptional regulator [Pseudarcicella sp.]
MKKIEHIDLSVKVFESLKQMILEGQYKPGQKLVQEKIAEQLGVSRMPLHRAFQMLESELMAEQKPRRGFYVAVHDEKIIAEAFEVREVLEGLAARTLALQKNHKTIGDKLFNIFKEYIDVENINEAKYRNSDRVFHTTLMELIDNSVLKKLNKTGHFLIHSFKSGLVRSPQETLQEHLEIIQFIKDGKASEAEASIKNHVRKSIETYKVKQEETQEAVK